MKEKDYNKLIRDNIPNIIRESGRTPVFKILNDNEFETALKEKLQEEVNEFLKNPSVEELCDIFDVIRAILVKWGVPPKEFYDVGILKVQKKGSFSERFYLLKIIDEPDIKYEKEITKKIIEGD